MELPESKSKNQKEKNAGDLFRNGKIFDETTTTEELINILNELSDQYVANAGVRHRQIIRALTVNNIINRRHVDAIERKNSLLTYINIILSIGIILLTIWGLNSSSQALIARDQLNRNHRQAVDFCTNNPEGEWPLVTGGMQSCEDVLKNE